MISQFIRAAPAIPTTTVANLAADLAAGRDVQVVDVRELSEWGAGHIPGARHIPLGELGQRLSELDRQRPTVMVCRSGNRSASATGALVHAGFPDVRNLDGGLVEWVRADHPVQR